MPGRIFTVRVGTRVTRARPECAANAISLDARYMFFYVNELHFQRYSVSFALKERWFLCMTCNMQFSNLAKDHMCTAHGFGLFLVFTEV